MKKRIIAAVVALGIASATYSQTNDALNRLEAGIETSYAQMERMTCTYELTRQVSLLSDAAHEKGTLTYSKSHRTLVLASLTTAGDSTIMNPMGITNVSGGKRVWTDAARSTALRQMLDIVMACFSGDFRGVRAAGNVTAKDQGGTTEVTFVPTDRRVLRHIGSITLSFGNDDYGLRRMTVVQRGGDFMAYTFGKKKVESRGTGRK